MNNVFKNSGCIKVKHFITQRAAENLFQYFQHKVRRREWLARPDLKGDPNYPADYFQYADPAAEVLLENSVEVVENHIGLKLEPTYSFIRVYAGGDELLPHVDREACEISVTLNIFCKDKPWPIFTKDKQNNVLKHILHPGEGLIYKGCELKHWRNKLPEGQIIAQIMLHYVDKNGQNKDQKFDKRIGIGFAPDNE